MHARSNLISDATHIVEGLPCRVIELPMFGQKKFRGTGFRIHTAPHRDDPVGAVRHLLGEQFRLMALHRDVKFIHRHNRMRVERLAANRARRLGDHVHSSLPRQMVDERLRHLGAPGVMHAHEKDTGGHCV